MDPEILAGLRDVHRPILEGIYWWPPAIGWWFLLIIVLLIPVVMKVIHIYRIRSAKHYALKEISRYSIEYGSDPRRFAQEVSVLLRRIAILKYGKEKVSSLSGVEWVSFLVKSGGLKIRRSLAMLFAMAPYSRLNKMPEDSVSELKEAAVQWIRKNT